MGVCGKHWKWLQLRSCNTWCKSLRKNINYFFCWKKFFWGSRCVETPRGGASSGRYLQRCGARASRGDAATGHATVPGLRHFHFPDAQRARRYPSLTINSLPSADSMTVLVHVMHDRSKCRPCTPSEASTPRSQIESSYIYVHVYISHSLPLY